MAKTIFTLPNIGSNWLDGYTDKYIILSLKMSDHGFSMFYRADMYGYTCHFLECGIFDKSVVEKDLQLYNNGTDTVAIPLTQDALHMLCIGSVTVCPDCLKRFETWEIEKPEHSGQFQESA